MPRKRPTEASWDSDEEELLDDGSEMTSNTGNKDEDLDEDALLGGSDDEGSRYSRSRPWKAEHKTMSRNSSYWNSGGVGVSGSEVDLLTADAGDIIGDVNDLDADINSQDFGGHVDESGNARGEVHEEFEDNLDLKADDENEMHSTHGFEGDEEAHGVGEDGGYALGDEYQVTDEFQLGVGEEDSFIEHSSNASPEWKNRDKEGDDVRSGARGEESEDSEGEESRERVRFRSERPKTGSTRTAAQTSAQAKNAIPDTLRAMH